MILYEKGHFLLFGFREKHLYKDSQVLSTSKKYKLLSSNKRED